MQSQPLDFLQAFFIDSYKFLNDQCKLGFVLLVVASSLIFALFLLLPWVPSIHNRLAAKRKKLGDPLFGTSIRIRLRMFSLYCLENRAVSYVFGVTLLLGLHLNAVSWSERFLMRFSPDRFGILICRFDGPDLRELFGRLGMAQKIDNEISERIAPSLRDSIEVQFSNQSFKTFGEAQEWGKKRGASLTIFGHTELSRDSLQAWVDFAGFKPIDLVSVYGPGRITISLPQATKLRVLRDQIDYGEHLSNWVRDLSLTLLIGSSVEKERWSSALHYLDEFDHSLDSSTTNCWVAMMLTSYCAAQCGDWRRSLSASLACDSCLSLQSFHQLDTRTNVLCQTATAKLHVGDSLGAIADLKQAVSLREGSTWPMVLLSHIYTDAKQEDSAFHYASLGLGLDSLSIDLNKCLAVNGNSASRHRNAISALRRLLSLDTADDYARLLLCDYYLASGLPESCLAALPERNLTDDTLYDRFEFCRMQAQIAVGTDTTALPELESLLSRYPCLSILYIDEALKMLERREFSSARGYLHRFYGIKSDPLDTCSERYSIYPAVLRERISHLQRSLRGH